MGIGSFLVGVAAAHARSSERAKAVKIMAMITEGTERLYELGGATFGADAAESVARGPDFIAAVQGIDAIVSRINAAFSVPNTDYELTIAASAVPLALDNLAKAIRRAGMRALVPDPH